MKKVLTSIALAAAMTTSAAADIIDNVPAEGYEIKASGTYPFLQSERSDCVIWLFVPFDCHNGFEYEEPGGPEITRTERKVIEDTVGGGAAGDDDDDDDDGNNGHGNDEDGVDESNPGKSKSKS